MTPYWMPWSNGKILALLCTVTCETFDKCGSDDVHVSSSKTTDKQGMLIQFTVCLMTVTLSLSKRLPHSMRTSVTYFIFLYSPFSLKSSGSCLRLLPRLPITSVAVYVFSFVFPSLLSFALSFFQWRVLEGNCYPRYDQSSYPTLYCKQDIPFFLDSF